jgi:poly(A) polymerase
MFFDPVRKVIIDHTGGLQDLNERSLRFIGKPAIRVQEDPIRSLRVIRFSSRLDFLVEKETYKAVVDFKQEIKKAAPPRLLEEILRMLRSGSAEKSFAMLWTTGLLDILLPELSCYLGRSLNRGEERDPGCGLWAYLWAIDRSDDPELLSNPVLLSALLLPVVMDAGGDPDAYCIEPVSSAAAEVVRALLKAITERIRLPKRDAERIGQLIAAQNRLFKLRRNMPLPRSLLRRTYFPEALDLFELGVRAIRKGRRNLNWLRGAYHQGSDRTVEKKKPKKRRRRKKRTQPSDVPSAPAKN